MVGPVIDARAARQDPRHDRAGQEGGEARVPGRAAGRRSPPRAITFRRRYSPTSPASASIAREEIFGPVVAILKAKDLDEAFAIANEVDYALTGGLFSRSPSALERAQREFRVGNLYLNRGITGAIVERHPFGGFRMSGGGTKAGGKGYLENFLFPRAVAENVMRRGLHAARRTSA